MKRLKKISEQNSLFKIIEDACKEHEFKEDLIKFAKRWLENNIKNNINASDLYQKFDEAMMNDPNYIIEILLEYISEDSVEDIYNISEYDKPKIITQVLEKFDTELLNVCKEFLKNEIRTEDKNDNGLYGPGMNQKDFV